MEKVLKPSCQYVRHLRPRWRTYRAKMAYIFAGDRADPRRGRMVSEDECFIGWLSVPSFLHLGAEHFDDCRQQRNDDDGQQQQFQVVLYERQVAEEVACEAEYAHPQGGSGEIV